jgi:ssDNA thymidine ADP-ribosyltransferase, DarT
MTLDEIRVGVAHFTHVRHLPTIIQSGIFSDSKARASGLLTTDVGDHEVKRRRSERIVPVYPGGTVSEYVPFYFASRSPMLYKIWKGEVRTYTEGQDPLVYLVTSLRRLTNAGLTIVITDGNAANEPTKFASGVAQVNELLDRDVLDARIWKDTPEDGDRMRRRMAECLVKDHVPFEAIERIVVINEILRTSVKATLRVAGTTVPVEVKPHWYYP